MTPTDLQTTLDALALRRPVFHSEADFQHELAWLLRERTGAEVRLERPFYVMQEPINLDLLLVTGAERVGIELKYWKRGRTLRVNGEDFVLKNQAAQDIGRYDFWWDVRRLERLREEGHITRGYAIALASDPNYWALGRPDTVDRAFRLHQGRVVSGVLAWQGAGKGTTRGREEDIALRGTYALDWRPYARPASDYALRALTVAVGGAVGVAPPPDCGAERPIRPSWRPRDRRHGRR